MKFRGIVFVHKQMIMSLKLTSGVGAKEELGYSVGEIEGAAVGEKHSCSDLFSDHEPLPQSLLHSNSTLPLNVALYVPN